MENYGNFCSQNSDNGTYSADEVVIGTWAGKTLYRKVIHIPSLPNSTTTYYPTNIDNPDLVMVDMGSTIWIVGTDTYAFNNNYNGIDIAAIQRERVGIKCTRDASQYSAYIVLQYTKLDQ